MFYDLLDALSFNGESHFKNHVNYLFRTDSKQKWTNEQTKYCVVVQPNAEGKVEILFLGELDERKKHAKLLNDTVKKLGLNNKFRMQAYYYDAFKEFGEDVEITDDDLKNATKRFVKDIESYGKPKKQQTICYVLHIDQNLEENLHVHRVFIQN